MKLGQILLAAIDAVEKIKASRKMMDYPESIECPSCGCEAFLDDRGRYFCEECGYSIAAEDVEWDDDGGEGEF